MTKVKVLGAPMSLATTKDPWYKVAYYLKRLPPWAKERLHWKAILARPAMVRAISAFSIAAHQTAGIDRWQRREILSQVLRKGPGAYGGKVRVKARRLSPEELEAVKSKIASAITVITAATPPEEALSHATALIAGGGR